MKGDVVGCFSYLCKKCNTSIKIDQECLLLYLIDGKVKEKLVGHYTGYGTVIDSNNNEILSVAP